MQTVSATANRREPPHDSDRAPAKPPEPGEYEPGPYGLNVLRQVVPSRGSDRLWSIIPIGFNLVDELRVYNCSKVEWVEEGGKLKMNPFRFRVNIKQISCCSPWVCTVVQEGLLQIVIE